MNFKLKQVKWMTVVVLFLWKRRQSYDVMANLDSEHRLNNDNISMAYYRVLTYIKYWWMRVTYFVRKTGKQTCYCWLIVLSTKVIGGKLYISSKCFGLNINKQVILYIELSAFFTLIWPYFWLLLQCTVNVLGTLRLLPLTHAGTCNLHTQWTTLSLWSDAAVSVPNSLLWRLLERWLISTDSLLSRVSRFLKALGQSGGNQPYCACSKSETWFDHYKI